MSEEELTVRSNDEIGHVAELIGRMTHSIRDAIGSAVSVGRQTAEKAELLAGLAKHTREAAIRIADDSLALSDMSSDNAAALEEANASVEEIASGAALGAKGATEGAESAQIVVDKANESSALAKKTAESIESIGKESKKTMEAVKGMETAVGSITSFVGTITSIADQTNLLALNAAIEAARAGEAGRGFAVVAEEVRKLAEESNVAAQEVRNFVEALGTHASATHSSMAQVDRIVMKTTEEAKTTSERLAEALTEVEKISEVLQSIAAATEEQAAASSEAAMGIDSVAQGVEKEASTMHEVTSTAEEAKADAEKVFSEAGLMLEIARSLEEDLRRFTL